MPATSPARLHVLLSRARTTAVVIRRGPSKRVCTFAWNRADDTFSIGQWLRGRIYERRCDLSLDGTYLIYFAMNGRWDSETKGAWTAVSRAPFLKALVLFAKGDCWHGGGLFTGAQRYWLNDGYGHQLMHDCPEVVRDRDYTPVHIGNSECLGVYYPRLLRDGWRLVNPDRLAQNVSLGVFEKEVGGPWMLRKLVNATTSPPVGRGVYYDEHELVNSDSGERLSFPEWEWADLDGERLVWAEAGRLYAGKLAPSGPTAVRQPRDFNSDEYPRIAAPY
jgi:hypothetical protein